MALKVELGSKAGALKQMLFDILEDSHEIRRLCIVGRNCILSRNNDLECSVPQEKQIAEGNLLVTYFQTRCPFPLLLTVEYSNCWNHSHFSHAEEEEEIEMLLENYLQRYNGP